MRNRRRISLCLLCCVMLLASCAQLPTDAGLTPVDPPAQVIPQPTDPDPDPAGPDLPDPPVDVEDLYIPIETIPLTDWAAQMDLSHFTDLGLSLENIFLSGEYMLFFFSPRNPNGTLAENTLIYSYSLAEGRFSFERFDAGLIGFYPRGTYDDGTISIVTLNSETYEYDSIVFIDPGTLQQTYVDFPAGAGDVIDLLISPDKQHYALTTYDCLSVRSASGEELYRLARAEGDDTHDDDLMLPYATGWSPDGNTLALHFVGWEWAYYPALFSLEDLSLTEYPDLESRVLSFLPSGKLVAKTWYTFLPAGWLDPSSGALNPLALPEGLSLPEELGGLTFSPQGDLVCLSLLPEDQGGAAIICADGRDSLTFALERAENDARFFEAAFFSADAAQLYLLSCATANYERQVYVLNLS